MKEYIVTWKETVTRSVAIDAFSAGSALEKWKMGIYDTESIEIHDATGKHNVEVRKA